MNGGINLIREMSCVRAGRPADMCLPALDSCHQAWWSCRPAWWSAQISISWFGSCRLVSSGMASLSSDIAFVVDVSSSSDAYLRVGSFFSLHRSIAAI